MGSRVWLERNSASAVLPLLDIIALVRSDGFTTAYGSSALWLLRCKERPQLTTNTLAIFLIQIMKAMWVGLGSVLEAGVAQNRSGDRTRF